MNKLRCIIVDDEPLARKGIEKYVSQIDFLSLQGTCKNAMQANSILKKTQIDLIFLDIEMPLLSGLDFLKSIKEHPPVIFTTAYPKYALEGYQFDVIDYLLKPISFERFLQACNKAERLLQNKKTIADEAIQDQHIYIKTDQQLVKVMIDDILYIESMQNYIVLHTVHEKHLSLVPMKNIFALLSKDRFIQIHKSYIIAKNKVHAIEGNQAHIGAVKLPISTRLKKEVIEALTGDRLLKK